MFRQGDHDTWLTMEMKPGYQMFSNQKLSKHAIRPGIKSLSEKLHVSLYLLELLLGYVRIEKLFI